MKFFSFLIPLIYLSLQQHEASSTISLSCETNSVSKSFDLPPKGLHVLIDNRAAWLEMEESGQAIRFSEKSTGDIDISSPFRYGWRWRHITNNDSIEIRRFDSNTAQARIYLKLHCSISEKLKSQLNWLKSADEINSKLERPIDKSDFVNLLERISEITTKSPNEKSIAFAFHLHAQALFVNGLSSDAITAFGLAENQWRAINDKDRALAALVGRAEELYSVGELSSIINITDLYKKEKNLTNYFSVRLNNTKCLALQSLNRLSDAERCYESVLSEYDKIGEETEYITSLQNYASLQRDLGNSEKALLLGQRALRTATGPNAPMIRGRLHVMLSSLALSRGDVIESLSQSNLALEEFSHARENILRWQANSYINLATLFTQLGARSEGYDALSEAISRISVKDAPARMALAMSIFSDLELESHSLDSAIFWKHLADETYNHLNMTAASDLAHVNWLQMEAFRGSINLVEQEIKNHSTSFPLTSSKWLLLSSQLAILQNRLDEARRALDDLRSSPLSLRDQIQLAQLNAEYTSRKLDTTGALNILLEAAKHIDALAQTTNNPTLRYVIARQILPLRRMAFSLALEQMHANGTSSVSIDAVWPWLALTASNPVDAIAYLPSTKTAEQFDRAVAEELLTSAVNIKPNAGSAAQHELLSLLAETHHAHIGIKKSGLPNTPITLANLQQTLAANSVFIAYIDGDTRGGLLWVTRDNALLLDAATPDEIRSSVLALRELLRSPSSPLLEIRDAAQRLSIQLFAHVPVTIAPQRLFVLADESLNGVGWSVLSWPAQTAETPQTLLDSSTISTVRLQRGSNVAATDATHNLHVLMAAQTGSASLPNLAGVGVEAGLIESAITDRTTVNLHGGASATRDNVLGALGEPGAWVHIAAHGMAQPQRIGYAGIWLEPAAPEMTPAFLSWLDVLDSGSHADLVVLNACQLGDSGNAINGNLSFAAAVSRAGAKKVVAALWPISDSASALWVPAFYSTMNQGPNRDAAEALRVAQLRLRNSRAFQHPFFWAGMQIIERLPVQDTDMDLAKLSKEKLH